MEHNTAERFRAILPLYGGMLAVGVYLADAGQCKTLLVIAGYYFAESVLLYLRANTSYIKPVFGPLVALTVILDLVKGDPLRVFVALLLFVALELVSNKHLVDLVERLTRQRLFGRCPSCNYANKQLTDRCKNCGFTATSGGLPPLPVIVDQKVLKEQCPGLSARLPRRCLSLLNLDENERCLGGLRIYPERGVYVDGVKVLVKYLVITSSRMIFLDYHFYYSGWTYRQDINIKDVATSIIVRTHNKKSQVPILVLTTAEASYELFYAAGAAAQEKVEAIESCVKLVRGGVNS